MVGILKWQLRRFNTTPTKMSETFSFSIGLSLQTQPTPQKNPAVPHGVNDHGDEQIATLGVKPPPGPPQGHQWQEPRHAHVMRGEQNPTEEDAPAQTHVEIEGGEHEPLRSRQAGEMGLEGVVSPSTVTYPVQHLLPPRGRQTRSHVAHQERGDVVVLRIDELGHDPVLHEMPRGEEEGIEKIGDIEDPTGERVPQEDVHEPGGIVRGRVPFSGGGRGLGVSLGAEEVGLEFEAKKEGSQ